MKITGFFCEKFGTMRYKVIKNVYIFAVPNSNKTRVF
jgi:hypothetical protein